MLVIGVPLSDAVSELLRPAMSERSVEQELAAYELAADRTLYGWSVVDALVCVAGISNDRPTADLLHLATAPGHERRGHAADLVRAAVIELALHELVAETDDDAVDFYRRTGFKVHTIASAWPGSRYRCTLRGAVAADVDTLAPLDPETFDS